MVTFTGLQGQVVREDPVEHLGLLEVMANRGQQGHRESTDPAEHQEQQELQDLLDQQEHQDPLYKLSSISGYEFDWIPKKGIHENDGRDIGVIAQEIERIFPQLVQTRDNGYKAVKYEKLVPVLIEAIKALKSEVDILRVENADIRNKINKL